MNKLRVVTFMLLVVTAFATMGGAYAAPPLQEEGERVGLFGTVSAIVVSTTSGGATNILDGGQIVTRD